MANRLIAGPVRVVAQGVRRVFPEEKATIQQRLMTTPTWGLSSTPAITERMCRWTGHGGRSSRSQTTSSHMSLNALSASLKLIAETALWCVPARAARPLEPSAVGTQPQTARARSFRPAPAASSHAC